jgi:uncharacterized membrane protein YfcA
MMEWLQSVDWVEITLLLVSGVVVGIINTLGGGGSVITMALFMAMGIPVATANGTNRIAVVMQNLSATIAFMRKSMVDIKNSLLLGVPTILGTIAGSLCALDVSESTFKICLSLVLAIILVYLILDRDKVSQKEGHKLRIRWWHYPIFFLVGFYGGYIYIGLGFLILAVTIWTMKLDIVTANVLKGCVIFISTPFALAVFMYNGQVDYVAGLVHAVGNILGAVMASHWAVSWGVKFVKWFTLFIIIVSFIDLVGLISLQDMLSTILN